MIKIKNGDVVQLVYNVVVKDVQGNTIHVTDCEKNIDFCIIGQTLRDSLRSADSHENREKLTKTEIVERLLSTHGGVFTVEFDKQDGTKRKLRGYLAKAEPLLGRSYCVDLDVPESTKLRLVDHRTIHSLVFDGVYYYV